MGIEEELVEMSTAYHGQRERAQQLEQLLREHYKLLKEYEKFYFFRATEAQRADLQKRTKEVLGEGRLV